MSPSSAPSVNAHSSPDVLIVGGGVIGSAIAYFLSTESAGPETAIAGGGVVGSGPSPRPDGAPAEGSAKDRLRIVVVEKDPTFARSSTALSVGGIRQQFSTPENIQMSLFSAGFFCKAAELLAVDGEAPELGFREAGYLFLATEAGMGILRRNHELQKQMGAEVEILDRQALSRRFPWLDLADLAAGSLGLSGEGWLDPHSLLQAFRKKARAQGVTFLTDEVVALEGQGGGHRLSSASLRSGGRVRMGAVVNAAGPRAAEVARMAGIGNLPVESRKRFVYRFHCREAPEDVPLTIDPSGVYFRPEGREFLCGVSPPAENDAPTLDLEMSYDLFRQVVWPTLARRVPAFEALKLGHSWAGHYAVNTLDRNAILGPHPDIPNFYFANGFSGHGLQHAPAVGRALADLILFGEHRTLELGRLGFERFASGRLVLEENVV